MNVVLRLAVHGIGAWAPGLPDWDALRAHLDGAADREDAPARPAATLLPPAERRRAPDTVRLAVDAAAQAVAMSGLHAADLPSVFASAHGDARIMDYMCATLATSPTELSPTRFHNSVHNAAAGYWTIATGCRRASNAVCADRTSFGAGLLEAATQAVTGNEPVLLAAFDAPGSGPLDEMIPTRVPFACALVLAPGTGGLAGLNLCLAAADDTPLAPRDDRLRKLARANACGDGLVLLEALARGASDTLRIPAGDGLVLRVDPGPRA
jgi:hypothetical protein